MQDAHRHGCQFVLKLNSNGELRNCRLYGCSEVTVEIGDFKNWQQVCVADIIADCVLGLDFMNAFNC